MDVSEVAGQPGHVLGHASPADLEAWCARAMHGFEEPLQALGWGQNLLDRLALQDVQGTYLHMGPDFATSLGYKSAELVGRNCYRYFHPDDFSAILQIHADRMATDVPVLGRIRFMRRDERWQGIQFLSTPLATVHGTIYGTLLGPMLELVESPSYQLFENGRFGANVIPIGEPAGAPTVQSDAA